MHVQTPLPALSSVSSELGMTMASGSVPTSLYYADPDGNGVELKIDNFNTPAEQHAWMHSAEFAANPLGLPLDPEKLALLSRQCSEDTPVSMLVHPTRRES